MIYSMQLWGLFSVSFLCKLYILALWRTKIYGRRLLPHNYLCPKVRASQAITDNITLYKKIRQKGGQYKGLCAGTTAVGSRNESFHCQG